jgi:hypothetical protein
MKYIAALGFLGMVSASGYSCHQHDGQGVDNCPVDQGCYYEQDQCHSSGDPGDPGNHGGSAPCTADEFDLGVINQKESGDCSMGGRYYIVVEADGNNRKIKYCRTPDPDLRPYCATEPEPDASTCNEGTELYQNSNDPDNPTDLWSVEQLCSMKPSSSGSGGDSPACPPTVEADFIGANGADWEVSVDGQQPASDPMIEVCPGATLRISINQGIDQSIHPLAVYDLSNNLLLSGEGDIVIPINAIGNATYVCTTHSSMKGTIKLLPADDPRCVCDSGSSEPPSDPGHPCDAPDGPTCPTGFTKRSPLPESLGPFPVKECCRPLKKGCMTQGKANYDSTAEVAGPCFDAYKSAQDKVNDFVGKTTFLGKRGVHKQHAKEDFYKKLAEGKTKRQAIREARAIMVEADLSEKVKKRARGTVKIAVAINSGEDSCELGASDDNCASLDLADDRTADETTILTTEDDAESWAVVVDGSEILVKQTRKLDGTFDMQCWDGSWGTVTNYDVSDDTLVKTHTCHDRVFLLGSTQLACDSTTCTDPNRACNAEGICACTADADSDGVCDGDEVAGCTSSGACNYNAAATDDNGSCTYAAAGKDCAGNCLADADSDGVCDGDEVAGCTSSGACNYNAAATDDNGSCTYAAAGKDCAGNCLEDADGDGVCDNVDTLIDSDGDGVADTEDVCENEDDDCSCYKEKNLPTKYIEKQCCDSSPASCE